MFDRDGFLSVLEDSGLSKGEVAILYGVSRQTIYNWIDGGEPTQSFIVRYAAATTKGIKSACRANLLPFPAVLTPFQRKKRLNAMVQHLHILAKPAPLEVK
jgi:predicted DNA-binding protein YlxM (UPF0122 family)